MSVRTTGMLVLLALGTACAGTARRTTGGPPPEYERPSVPEWDAGTPVDPLEQAAARGEAVDEPETLESAPDGAVTLDGAPDAGTP